jgi:hypothetical protein
MKELDEYVISVTSHLYDPKGSLVYWPEGLNKQSDNRYQLYRYWETICPVVRSEFMFLLYKNSTARRGKLAFCSRWSLKGKMLFVTE